MVISNILFIFVKTKNNSMEQYEVKCNWCDWIGYDDDLKVEVDLSDNPISHDVQYRKVCPECLSEDYLMDIENEENEI